MGNGNGSNGSNGHRGGGKQERPIVLISTPSAHMTPGYVGSMEKLTDLFYKKGWPLGRYRETGDGIVRARNRAVEFFLRHPVKPTHLMCIDDDLEFDPQDVVTMIESGLDVVGGVYPYKRIDWHKVYRMAREGVPPERLASMASPLCWNPEATQDEIDEIGKGPERGVASLDAKVLKDGHGHNFVRVKDLPNGFMLFKREVFEKIRDHYGDKIAFTPSVDHAGTEIGAGAAEPNETGTAKRHLYFHMDRYPDSPDGDYMSEDWWFCRQWQNMGGEVYAFAECRLTHFGTHAFSGCVADQLVLGDAPEKKEDAQVSQPSAE